MTEEDIKYRQILKKYQKNTIKILIDHIISMKEKVDPNLDILAEMIKFYDDIVI